MLNDEESRQALAHVLWISGAPDAGKTSVVTMLVEKYGLQVYSCDEHAEDHWLNHISQDPASFGHTWLSLSLDERWLQPPETQLQNVLQITEDDFPFVVGDLLKMSKAPLIMVDGNIPPKLVEPLLTTNQQAIWLVPTDSFYRASFFRRQKHLGHNNRSDPQQTRDNHMARDRLFAEYIKEEALTRRLALLEIDGSRSLREVADMVEAHFASFLNPLHPD
jgi:hypothetical protein